MHELPLLSGQEIIKILRRLGFTVVRQRGSHIVLRKGRYGCVIPNHREVARGTLRNTLKQANITIDEFISEHEKG
jgi:predicted RNA binding protein YcfA (HicA-like mRNA interferase family)